MCGSWGIFYIMPPGAFNYISRPHSHAIYFLPLPCSFIGLYRISS